MRSGALLVTLIVACAAPASVPSPAPTAPVPTATATPISRPTPTAAPTPLPSPSPSPSASPSASASPSPSSSPTPIARPSGSTHYVAIGASDTVGIGSLDPANGSWPSRLAALLPTGSTYRNLGVSGSLTAQAQREQLPTAVREQPTVVTIWLVVNDINAGVTPQDHSAGLGAIVDALVAGTSARIFVGNVPDLRAVPLYSVVDPAVLLARIDAYNTGIAAVAAKQAGPVTVVDLFTGSAALTTQLTVSPDGFHPSDAGYVLIAQRFAEAMRRGGVPLRPGP